MKAGAYQLLQCLKEKAMLTNDKYVVLATIPSNIHRDNRKSLADELEHGRYICKVNFIGKDKIQCELTEKGMNA